VKVKLEATLRLGETAAVVERIEAAIFDGIQEARVVEVQVVPST
jgi:hypothetical protein